MPEPELTSVQRFVLLTLMINAAPLPYKAVKNSLTAAKRTELKDWKYIEVSDTPMTLDLTQLGHDRAVSELAGEQPPRSGPAGLALVAALGFVKNLIEQTGITPQDLFRFRTAALRGITPPRDSDLEDRIRAAYSALTGQPGDYLMLEDLRQALPDVSRGDLDAALVELNRHREVSLIPESNQKVLTHTQRAAAVSLGNQFKHLIAIGI
jgi:hypothetical protein